MVKPRLLYVCIAKHADLLSMLDEELRSFSLDAEQILVLGVT